MKTKTLLLTVILLLSVLSANLFAQEDIQLGKSFKFELKQRTQVRKELNINKDDSLIIFSSGRVMPIGRTMEC